MAKRRKNKEVKNLDLEVSLVQREEFTNNFDKSVKKELKNDIGKVAIILGPFILLLTVFAISSNVIFLTISIAYLGLVSCGKLIKDFIRDIKKINNRSFNSQLLDEEEMDNAEEKTVEQILEEGIGKKEDKDFYTQDYKNLLEQTESEDRKKFREAFDKQNDLDKLNNPKLQVVGEFLDKDETIKQIKLEIETYNATYNVSDMTITDEEWNCFFDSVYEMLGEKKLNRNFYDAISTIVRFTYAKNLVNHLDNLGISNFIENLYYLQNGQIGKKEVALLQKEIIEKVRNLKVINFTDIESAKGHKK